MIQNNFKYKNMLKTKLKLIAAAFALFVFPAIAFAAERGEEFNSLFVALDIISFALVFIALIMVFGLARAYGDSVIGVSLLYFLIGTFFLGSIRLFFFLNGSGIISVDEMTADIVWHVFHWLSLAAYLVAGKKLIWFVDNKSNSAWEKPSYYKAAIVGLLSSGFVLVVVLTATLYNDIFDQYEGTWLDQAGLIHFISFIFGGIVAFYMLKIRKRLMPAIAVIAAPLVINIVLLSVSHFWELLTESWRIISLTDEAIEKTEQLIMFPGYIVIVYAFWRSTSLLKKVINSR